MIPARVLLCVIVPAQLTPSPDPRPLPISGVVVNSTGKPVAGAEVWLADGSARRDHRLFGDEMLLEPLTEPGEGLAPVLVHATTDQAGKFSLEAPLSYTARRWRSPLVLFATKGTARAIRRLPIVLGPDQSPVTIALGAPSATEMSVVDPQGKPIADAKVWPMMVDDVPIPEVVARTLGGTTDSQGRVAMWEFPNTALQKVRVEASGFGTQCLRVVEADSSDGRSHSATVALAPVGHVVGRLVPPGNEPIKGVTVRATTREGGYEGSRRYGMAEVAVEESGRFEIGGIVAGMAEIELLFDPRTGTNLRTEALGRMLVEAGKTNEMTIPMLAAVRVKGSLREKGTDKPIAGVKVALNLLFGGDDFAVTGTDGTYEGCVARENSQPRGWPVRIPIPFFWPSAAGREVPQRMPPPGTDELRMPVEEQPRGVDVPGSVVNEMGRPVSGAQVEAMWAHPTGRVQLVSAGSDSRGRFVLHGVDPLAELTYKARLADAVSAGGIVARAEASLTNPVVITVSPRNSIPVSGRVLDSTGRPIAGASVRVVRLHRGKYDRVVDLEPIMSDDGRVFVRTDSDGRYRAPRQVLPADEYFAEVGAPGRLSTRSTAVRSLGQRVEIPPVTLGRVRSISGLVVDRQGGPVPGALIRQAGNGPMPTKIRSDEQGRFQLSGVLEGPTIFLVEKSGFRSEPHVLAASEKPITIAVRRADEPPAVSYKTLPSALPADQEKALARRLFEPFAEHVLKDGQEAEKRDLLTRMAEIDPTWTLEHLDEVKFSDLDDVNDVRSSIAGALVRDNPDEASAVTEQIGEPSRRALAYAGMTRDLLHRDPARARKFLDQAILNNKAAKPRSRIFVGREVIGLLVDLGETARAREMLRAQRELIESYFTGKSRSSTIDSFFLLPLSRLDPPSALAEIEAERQKAVKDKDVSLTRRFDNLFGRIAPNLADRLPAEAERLMRQNSFSMIRPANDAILAVCSRMASKDLPRARRIADLIAPGEIEKKPFALGLMAQALAATDKPAALGLLDEAFRELEGLRSRGRVSQFASISGTAGGLLPIVEQVDPNRLPDFLTRTLALRPSQNEGKNSSWIPEQAAALAMMVARYDRKLAAQVIQPDLDNLGRVSLSYGGADRKTNRALCALTLIDPHKAVELIEALPESPSTAINGFAPTKNDIVIEAARLLSLHGADRWRHIYDRYLLLWTPDQELR